MSSPITLREYTLRGTVGGATLPALEDYVDLGPKWVTAILFPVAWTAASFDLDGLLDLGDVATMEVFESISGMGGYGGAIKTFSRVESTMSASAPNFALHPFAAHGVDMTLTLLLISAEMD